jgi:hypothetical protein
MAVALEVARELGTRMTSASRAGALDPEDPADFAPERQPGFRCGSLRSPRS